MTEAVGEAAGSGAARAWFRDPRYDAGLDDLAALEVAEAQLYALRARTLARLASRTSRQGWQGDAPFDSLLLDVAGTCVLGQVAAGSRLLDAEHLVLRLPDTLAALEAGRVRVHQVRVLLEQTRDLPAQTCAELERRVLPRIGPLCPADLRRLLKRLVLQLESEDAQAAREAEQRRRQARADRRTWVRPGQDGMAVFGAVLPAEQAQQLQARLTEQARQARAAGDGRGLDQLRADLLAEVPTCPGPCTGGRAGPRPRPPVQVVVHVPLAVALGVSDAPGELEGYGPVDAQHARRLLADAELRRACVDPVTGRVWALDGETVRLPPPTAPATSPATASATASATCGAVLARGERPSTTQRPDSAVRAALLALAALPPPVPLPPEPQHDPSAALARLVRVRQVRCDGLGCAVPARRCELDHHDPWPEGATSRGNLRPRSQRCHHAKHAGWSATLTDVGTTWTSPGGRSYLVPDRTPVHLPGPPRRRQDDNGGQEHWDGLADKDGHDDRDGHDGWDGPEHWDAQADWHAQADRDAQADTDRHDDGDGSDAERCERDSGPDLDLRGHDRVVGGDDDAPF